MRILNERKGNLNLEHRSKLKEEKYLKGIKVTVNITFQESRAVFCLPLRFCLFKKMQILLIRFAIKQGLGNEWFSANCVLITYSGNI